MEKETQLKILQSRYYKTYFKMLAIFIFIGLYFLVIRYFVPNEKISPLIIFPVFIVGVIMVIKAMKQMKQIRNEVQEIKKHNS